MVWNARMRCNGANLHDAVEHGSYVVKADDKFL